ncbi:MAG TPA: NAD(P)-binding protein [Pseudonocardia sp.]|uniref:NAD(P)-binding protein n=1 Tax=Pseudonocardia sp. TaxID=60912 RepID=UPI002ED8BE78
MVSGMSRRAFLGGAAGAAVLGLGGTGVAAASTSDRGSSARWLGAGLLGASVTEERRRAVVIGSGFGGAVTALRLAKAGVPVLMLERGLRWPTGPNAETFPHMFSPDRRCSWLSPTPALGNVPPAVSAVHRRDGAGARRGYGHCVRRRRRRRFAGLSRHDRSAH